MKITSCIQPDNQYIKEEFTKRSIVLHHTAGSFNGFNTIHGWNLDPVRVGVSYVVCGHPDKTKSYVDGQILKAFEDKYWAYHLGVKAGNGDLLNASSVGIEICSYGQLIQKEDKFYNYLNQAVPRVEVVELLTPHKGFKYYHTYTDAQIESVRQLIVMLKDKYAMNIFYQPNMFDISAEAINGKGGLWSHNSFRVDKTDVFPHPKLIEMLKTV